MQLKLVNLVLESVQFAHVGDYMSKDVEKEQGESPARLEINVHHDANDKKAFVRLRVTCDDPGAPYSYAVAYVAFFSYEGDAPHDVKKRFAVTGGNMALPFVRELVANLSSRGRFGTTWVGPVNFNKVVQEGEESKQSP